MKTLFLTALACLGLTTLPAHAVLTNSAPALPGPLNLIDFESFDGLLTSGPEVLNSQVTFTGDLGSELGAAVRDLNDNGAWGAAGRFAASGFVGELRFTFSDLTLGAGAFVNHFAQEPLPFAVVISAYGNNNQIIETHTVTINTAFDSYNEGVFLGISRPDADIRSLSFKGVGVVLDDFSYVTPVPEAGTWMMMLGGLAVAGAVARRRQACGKAGATAAA